MSKLVSETSQLPKYVRLAERLRGQILRGELRPTDRVPSFPQLRSEFGISQNTVEKAHALLEQEGLIIRRQGYGTFVAETSRRPATGLIGLYGVSPLFRHLPYYVHLLRGIQSAANRLNREILLFNPLVPSVGWEKVDGMLILEPKADKIIRTLPPGMHSVAVLHAISSIPSVISDDYMGMRQAVNYLWAHGHRKIAYLYENDDLTPVRLGGYRDELKALGLSAKASAQHLLVPHHPEEFRGRGRETMRAWLKGGWQKTGCTALICQNDRTAIGVLEALREAGISAPEEISLVGFDSTDECDLVTPRLTSVKVPLEEVGEKATEVLCQMMESDAKPNQIAASKIALPTKIEERESVADLN
jgi:GntR family transcriptional regulator of arabinose operon